MSSTLASEALKSNPYLLDTHCNADDKVAESPVYTYTRVRVKDVKIHCLMKWDQINRRHMKRWYTDTCSSRDFLIPSLTRPPALSLPSNAVALKGISRQAICLPYFTSLMLLMKCGLLWQERERVHDSFNNQTVLFFETTDDLNALCEENRQPRDDLTPNSFRVHLY